MNLLTPLYRQALVCLCLLIWTSGRAQNVPDTLVLHNGSSRIVHITELGLDEIKYHLPNNTMIVSIERREVAIMKLSDGREVRIPRSVLGADLPAAAIARTQAVKFHFLSPAFNHITFSYERMLKPWSNLEFTAGYIGAGFNTTRTPHTGFLFRGGVKFISRPEVVTRGMRLSHALNGRYVKPELALSAWSTRKVERENPMFNTARPEKAMDLAFMVVVGKQRFLGDGATLDTWIGVGYAMRLAAVEDAQMVSSSRYTHQMLSTETPLVISAGMSLGLAFGKDKRMQ